MIHLALLSLLSFAPAAFALETELSGNIEGQTRHSWNNQEAKDDLFQDWDEADFHLAYGNLNGKLIFNDISIEANWFVRYSQSELYDPEPNMFRGDSPYLATRIYTFPNQLVARDVFKLQYENQENDYLIESVLNKFLIEWNQDDFRVSAGRIYINYGLGETFNPINPFNQPTGLTSIQQVAQGNDGGSVAFFLSDKHTVDFILLGDKRIDGYEGQIDETLWVHGEYQATDKLQLDYLGGVDQNRNKAGGQVIYRFEEAMVFLQALYESRLVTRDPSNSLWNLMLGYDQQLTNIWHIRGEAGYQERNEYISPFTLGERFLPSEYFVSLANIFEVHPLLKMTGTVVYDFKSGFTYLIGKATYSVHDNVEAEVFGYLPAAKGDDADNPAQKLVTTDIGLALRAFF